MTLEELKKLNLLGVENSALEDYYNKHAKMLLSRSINDSETIGIIHNALLNRRIVNLENLNVDSLKLLSLLNKIDFFKNYDNPTDNILNPILNNAEDNLETDSVNTEGLNLFKNKFGTSNFESIARQSVDSTLKNDAIPDTVSANNLDAISDLELLSLRKQNELQDRFSKYDYIKETTLDMIDTYSNIYEEMQNKPQMKNLLVKNLKDKAAKISPEFRRMEYYKNIYGDIDSKEWDSYWEDIAAEYDARKRLDLADKELNNNADEWLKHKMCDLVDDSTKASTQIRNTAVATGVRGLMGSLLGIYGIAKLATASAVPAFKALPQILLDGFDPTQMSYQSALFLNDALNIASSMANDPIIKYLDKVINTGSLVPSTLDRIEKLEVGSEYSYIPTSGKSKYGYVKSVDDFVLEVVDHPGDAVSNVMDLYGFSLASLGVGAAYGKVASNVIKMIGLQTKMTPRQIANALRVANLTTPAIGGTYEGFSEAGQAYDETMQYGNDAAMLYVGEKCNPIIDMYELKLNEFPNLNSTDIYEMTEQFRENLFKETIAKDTTALEILKNATTQANGAYWTTFVANSILNGIINTAFKNSLFGSKVSKEIQDLFKTKFRINNGTVEATKSLLDKLLLDKLHLGNKSLAVVKAILEQGKEMFGEFGEEFSQTYFQDFSTNAARKGIDDYVGAVYNGLAVDYSNYIDALFNADYNFWSTLPEASLSGLWGALSTFVPIRPGGRNKIGIAATDKYAEALEESGKVSERVKQMLTIVDSDEYKKRSKGIVGAMSFAEKMLNSVNDLDEFNYRNSIQGKYIMETLILDDASKEEREKVVESLTKLSEGKLSDDEEQAVLNEFRMNTLNSAESKLESDETILNLVQENAKRTLEDLNTIELEKQELGKYFSEANGFDEDAQSIFIFNKLMRSRWLGRLDSLNEELLEILKQQDLLGDKNNKDVATILANFGTIENARKAFDNKPKLLLEEINSLKKKVAKQAKNMMASGEINAQFEIDLKNLEEKQNTLNAIELNKDAWKRAKEVLKDYKDINSNADESKIKLLIGDLSEMDYNTLLKALNRPEMEKTKDLIIQSLKGTYFKSKLEDAAKLETAIKQTEDLISTALGNTNLYNKLVQQSKKAAQRNIVLNLVNDILKDERNISDDKLNTRGANLLDLLFENVDIDRSDLYAVLNNSNSNKLVDSYIKNKKELGNFLGKAIKNNMFKGMSTKGINYVVDAIQLALNNSIDKFDIAGVKLLIHDNLDVFGEDVAAREVIADLYEKVMLLLLNVQEYNDRLNSTELNSSVKPTESQESRFRMQSQSKPQSLLNSSQDNNQLASLNDNEKNSNVGEVVDEKTLSKEEREALERRKEFRLAFEKAKNEGLKISDYCLSILEHLYVNSDNDNVMKVLDEITELKDANINSADDLKEIVYQLIKGMDTSTATLVSDTVEKAIVHINNDIKRKELQELQDKKNIQDSKISTVALQFQNLRQSFSEDDKYTIAIMSYDNVKGNDTSNPLSDFYDRHVNEYLRDNSSSQNKSLEIVLLTDSKLIDAFSKHDSSITNTNIPIIAAIQVDKSSGTAILAENGKYYQPIGLVLGGTLSLIRTNASIINKKGVNVIENTETRYLKENPYNVEIENTGTLFNNLLEVFLNDASEEDKNSFNSEKTKAQKLSNKTFQNALITLFDKIQIVKTPSKKDNDTFVDVPMFVIPLEKGLDGKKTDKSIKMLIRVLDVLESPAFKLVLTASDEAKIKEAVDNNSGLNKLFYTINNGWQRVLEGKLSIDTLNENISKVIGDEGRNFHLGGHKLNIMKDHDGSVYLLLLKSGGTSLYNLKLNISNFSYTDFLKLLNNIVYEDVDNKILRFSTDNEEGKNYNILKFQLNYNDIKIISNLNKNVNDELKNIAKDNIRNLLLDGSLTINTNSLKGIIHGKGIGNYNLNILIVNPYKKSTKLNNDKTNTNLKAELNFNSSTGKAKKERKSASVDLTGNKRRLPKKDNNLTTEHIEKIFNSIFLDNKNRLSFDRRNHTYSVDGVEAKKSVTSFVHEAQNKSNTKQTTYKDGDRIKQGDNSFIARFIGNDTDNKARKFFDLPFSKLKELHKQKEDDIEDNDIKQFKKALDSIIEDIGETNFTEKNTKFYSLEDYLRVAGVYNGDIIAGTMDLVAVSNGLVYIYDFKTQAKSVRLDLNTLEKYLLLVELYKLILLANYPLLDGKVHTRLIRFNVSYPSPKNNKLIYSHNDYTGDEDILINGNSILNSLEKGLTFSNNSISQSLIKTENELFTKLNINILPITDIRTQKLPVLNDDANNTNNDTNDNDNDLNLDLKPQTLLLQGQLVNQSLDDLITAQMLQALNISMPSSKVEEITKLVLEEQLKNLYSDSLLKSNNTTNNNFLITDEELEDITEAVIRKYEDVTGEEMKDAEKEKYKLMIKKEVEESRNKDVGLIFQSIKCGK